MAPKRVPKDKAPSRRAGEAAAGGFKKRGLGNDSKGGPSDGGSKGFESSNPLALSSNPPQSAKDSTVQGNRPGTGRRRSAQRAIPDAVANRMARRSAIASGLPTLMGMAVFVGSYLLVTREILEIPPAATLVASGGCFLLGLVGLSYGVFSSSWEEQPGSLLGSEQIRVNLSRLRESIRSMRQAG